MRWTGGVHRRSGDLLVILIAATQWEFLVISGRRGRRLNRAGQSVRVRETRTQCECATSPDLGRWFIATLFPACGLWSELAPLCGRNTRKVLPRILLCHEKIHSTGSRSEASRSCLRAQLHVCGGHRVTWALGSLSVDCLTNSSSHPAVKIWKSRSSSVARRRLAIERVVSTSTLSLWST